MLKCFYYILGVHPNVLLDQQIPNCFQQSMDMKYGLIDRLVEFGRTYLQMKFNFHCFEYQYKILPLFRFPSRQGRIVVKMLKEVGNI